MMIKLADQWYECDDAVLLVADDVWWVLKVGRSALAEPDAARLGFPLATAPVPAGVEASVHVGKLSMVKYNSGDS